MALYPSFCLFPADAARDDPVLAQVAGACGLGARRPGLVLEAVDGLLRVLVSAEGETALLDPARVRLGVAEDVALGLMDALEEAIEDARGGGAAGRAERLEATLALLERTLGDDEAPGAHES